MARCLLCEPLEFKVSRWLALTDEIMLESRAHGMGKWATPYGNYYFEVQRTDFEIVFQGMPTTVMPFGTAPRQVKKSIRLAERVEFYCLYIEEPEGGVYRLLDLVHPDKRVEFVRNLKAQKGGKEINHD